MSRKVSGALKMKVAGRQHFRCANEPGSNLVGLEKYDCISWKLDDGNNKGYFDEAGYEIDHIIEHSISHDDREENLQALCKTCHSVKTKRFLMNRKTNTNKQYNENEITNKNKLNIGFNGKANNNNNKKMTGKSRIKRYKRYQCNRCKKKFEQKCKYDEHSNRKILCIWRDTPPIDNAINDYGYYCDICEKTFGRMDGFKRHLCSKIHIKRKEATVNNSNLTNNDNVTNNNNVTNNGKNNGVVQNVGDVTIINNTHYHFIPPLDHKESGKSVVDNYNIKTNKIGLKEGYTMEYVIEQMNQKAELEKKKINLRKEIALYVLNLIDSLNDVEYDNIVYIIYTETDIKVIELIINLLGDSHCFGVDINRNIIQKQIEKQKQTDIFMETNLF